MAGELVLTAGVLVLLLVVWLLWWSGRSAQAAATSELSGLHREWTSTATAPAPMVATGQPASGKPFAELRIPRFGAGWREPVLQGTGAAQLRKGVGHYAGTALPGAVGNLGIAGHRTTHGHPFADVERLRTGDEVIVETADGTFVYRVTGHEVVPPTRGRVLDPAGPGQARLTLTTCHPKYSARRRWIVHAELTSSRARPESSPPRPAPPPVRPAGAA